MLTRIVKILKKVTFDNKKFVWTQNTDIKKSESWKSGG